jgi:hypothetical protein
VAIEQGGEVGEIPNDGFGEDGRPGGLRRDGTKGFRQGLFQQGGQSAFKGQHLVKEGAAAREEEGGEKGEGKRPMPETRQHEN